MNDATAEQVTAQPYHLPENEPYPEAIRDPLQLNALVAYFRPHIRSEGDEVMFQRVLYNPLNIEYVAREFRIPCPAGYSAAEMQLHVDATLNAMVPCRVCGDPIRLHGRAYKELGGRCHWDCYESSSNDDGDANAVNATQIN